MGIYLQLLLIRLILDFTPTFCGDIFDENTYKWPTVGVSVLVRNKAHALPYFLSSLVQLDYPKDRIYIWMYSDYNEDNSIEILESWADRYMSEYGGINITADKNSGPRHNDEEKGTHWSPKHFKHVIRLREESLGFFQRKWADFLFMLDADVFFTNRQTLKQLVRKNFAIVAPMLISDGLYSNFWLEPIFVHNVMLHDPLSLYEVLILYKLGAHIWCGMTENYYYMRTDEYKPIQSRKEVGCFSVPMVHTAVLISLRHRISDLLTYDPSKIKGYDGPEDDIIAFAVNAKKNDITLNICNDQLYGFVPVPLEDGEDLTNDSEQLLNLKLEAISRGEPLPLLPALATYVRYPEKWKFSCDEIYMINLERRKERRELMEASFKELGIDATLFKAVDGRNLDVTDLREYSAALMPDYLDPYHKRPMKAGEVGCFLSHYYIWEKIVKHRHAVTLVLEDDVRFVPYFRHRFLQLLEELKQLDWDLVYIGRKILLDGEEEYVTEHITRPLYSYWTLGYLLSERGAKKLLDARPLASMLPVDEYLPVMFDQHPNETWKAHFPNRNLKAFSAAPLLVYPTHYTGQDGYISDTEDSTVLEHMHNVKNEL